MPIKLRANFSRLDVSIVDQPSDKEDNSYSMEVPDKNIRTATNSGYLSGKRHYIVVAREQNMAVFSRM